MRDLIPGGGSLSRLTLAYPTNGEVSAQLRSSMWGWLLENMPVMPGLMHARKLTADLTVMKLSELIVPDLFPDVGNFLSITARNFCPDYVTLFQTSVL
jgi:hypothetical protein